MLILAAGDLHIPHRALEIPHKFRALLAPGKVNHILCTGNLSTRESKETLRKICSDMTCVTGEYDETHHDEDSDTAAIRLGNYKIGLVHGHQIVPWGDKEALSMWAKKLDVDILVTGCTHKLRAFEHEGTVFVNPGSMTGAFSNLDNNTAPSFALLELEDGAINVYSYQLDGEDVKVKKKVFSKRAAGH
eukprot:NODE_8929_length_673_cov_116.114545_g8668_i0.p1 GENE.NODE_8929_length_673_cov_116.114545_g8668_i0~~NODE_8929_length_673_cov_116.114545_g8668_i0.p1  ORF type:complete len:189 (+),score=39.01 NODE_8929_length_673_cov_116.114545_g8668_i0:44-610(+)